MNLANRLRLARENAGLKQKEVSERTNIDDSSLSAFENGRNEPRFAQLAKLADVYRLPLSYFFDESEAGPQSVMWRNKPGNANDAGSDFLELCRQYHQLEMWTGDLTEKPLPSLAGGRGPLSYAKVMEMATDARNLMGLGERPGESLYRVLEEVFGVKIFHLDLRQSGAAACAVSPDFGQAILLNTRSSRWRRNHDLAHELFHLLTWDYFHHSDDMSEPSEEEEKLATCFAGNLLLPKEPVTTAIAKASEKEGRVAFVALDQIARQFDVSLESLLWRMHFLYNWSEAATKELIDRAKEYIKTADRSPGPEPTLLPERYRALAIEALQSGRISLGRFAKFMRVSRKEAECYAVAREPDYAEVPASPA
jgi:Zn-dependent peptidase ImmA (M78 family)/transcriptional regulator with XRE-family HTH domain